MLSSPTCGRVIVEVPESASLSVPDRVARYVPHLRPGRSAVQGRGGHAQTGELAEAEGFLSCRAGEDGEAQDRLLRHAFKAIQKMQSMGPAASISPAWGKCMCSFAGKREVMGRKWEKGRMGRVVLHSKTFQR